MNLQKKKELAARTLTIGKDRIMFNTSRLDEIKEAITKQDIKDLKERIFEDEGDRVLLSADLDDKLASLDGLLRKPNAKSGRRSTMRQ